MRDWEAHPYRNSLSALALIGMRSAGADAYAYFEQLRETGTLRRLTGCGTPIPESAALSDSGCLLAFPLHAQEDTDGLLAFAFSAPSKVAEARTRLRVIAETIERLWGASTAIQYSNLVKRIVALENRLVDSKIADRAQGALHSGALDAAAIERHVDRILERSATRNVLATLLSELEEEVEERHVATVAKRILQSTAGMTEEEAHAHLRMLSRRSRKRLKDAASDVIEGHGIPSPASKS